MIIDINLYSFYDYLPSQANIAKSVLTVTVASIALNALASLPGAEAGPVTYTACAAVCATLLPPAIPVCLAGCLPSLGPWCP
jgi:hypothetical protein